ncbi:hypothetical protein TNCV_786711 [Trichonephila clavipes]|nr:hypothetical protein TNCV_786711 [Trichonephila clavipes]
MASDDEYLSAGNKRAEEDNGQQLCTALGRRLSLFTVTRRLYKGRETVLASSFYSQYGLPTISGLPLHDDKRRYRPEKSMTDTPKGLSTNSSWARTHI